MGRKISLAQAAGGACLVSFEELCGTERGEADFIALADNFSAVLMSGLPRFVCLEASDEVRRFVKLLDDLFRGIREEVSQGDARDLAWRTALYSADGKVGMAPSAIGTLCEAIRATERAESRLREMRTRRYWQGYDAARGAP